MKDLDFNKLNGLIPVVTQDYESGKILMLAFVNEEAFNIALQTKKATYFSRTKNRVWCKGETSGNYQEIIDILLDCDNDSLIFKVKQHGLKASCHTGYESCFYRHLVDGKWETIKDEKKIFDPKDVYEK